MGMFDYVTCKCPLPVAGANGLTFQSKDTPAQFMDQYEIREDGTLWHEDYDFEDRSDPNAEGLMRFSGLLTAVNKRWERVELTEEIVFYHYDQEADRNLEFSARFVRGRLKRLEVLDDGSRSYRESLGLANASGPEQEG